MPSLTQQHAGITVPDLTHLHIDKAISKITKQGFRYEITDRRSSTNVPPDYILNQRPKPGTIVKPNRKLFFTVNIANVIEVITPDIVGLSLRNAQLQIENKGLILGSRSYESARFRNTITRQSIPAGTIIKKGTRINVVLSDGLGKKKIKIPNIIGIHLSKASEELFNNGLDIKEIRYQETNEIPPQIVMGIYPDTIEVIEGTEIDLIVSEPISEVEATIRGFIIEGDAFQDSLYNNYIPNNDSIIIVPLRQDSLNILIPTDSSNHK